MDGPAVPDGSGDGDAAAGARRAGSDGSAADGRPRRRRLARDWPRPRRPWTRTADAPDDGAPQPSAEPADGDEQRTDDDGQREAFHRPDCAMASPGRRDAPSGRADGACCPCAPMADPTG